jgi:hypothetical protein
LNVFMLKYSAMSSTLISKGALSPLDHVGRLLDGLSVELRRKVLKFYAKKSWRLSAHDTGTNDPVFDELKEFILTEAQAAQKETVYSNERASRENSTISIKSELPIDIPAQTSTSAPTSASTSTSTSPPAPMDPITELTKQFSNLALLIQANMRPSQPRNSASTAQPGQSNQTHPPYFWCDTTEHSKWMYQELKEAINHGEVKFGDTGRIVNCSAGMDVPLMTGRGGMKVFPYTGA